MAAAPSPVERARRVVEVACFAPIGIVCYLADMAPNLITILVARGQGEVSRRQEQVGDAVRHARTRGEALIAFGMPQKVRRNGVATTETAENHASGNGHRGERTAPVADDIVRLQDDRDAADLLPIPGYDSLSASQVVDRLAGLDADDLDAVRAYEVSHRNRRTIIGKIEQLI